MKIRFIFLAVLTGIVFLSVSTGSCQNAVGKSEWVEKVGRGSVNWSAGYIEAIGIGTPPDRSGNKINVRPTVLRAAKVDAYHNLLEITKGIQVNSRTSIKDFTTESDITDTQVRGLTKGAQVVDQQYMSNGTMEVRVRIPLYGNLSQIIIPLSIDKHKSVPLPAPSSPVSAAPIPDMAASPAPGAHTGLVVDARGIGARPAMLPGIFDENGKEVYAFTGEDECIVQQGRSGYARDLPAAEGHPRVAAHPVTVKALKTSGPGGSDLMIRNVDALKLRDSAESASFIKKCRVMIVLD